jgi:hypothetical protein
MRSRYVSLTVESVLAVEKSPHVGFVVRSRRYRSPKIVFGGPLLGVVRRLFRYGISQIGPLGICQDAIFVLPIGREGEE